MDDEERTTLRVALVTPPLGNSGGIGRVTAYALPGLRAHGHVVRVLDSRGSSPHPVVSVLPLTRTVLHLVLLRLTARMDLVHVNMSSHGSTLRKSVVVRVCRALRVPVVLHVHAGDLPEFFDPLPGALKSLVRRTVRSADLVLALSDRCADYVHRALGVPPELLEVLPNACPGPVQVAPARRSAEEPLRVAFLGELSERKGVPELLDALALVDAAGIDWQATLAGGGDVERYRNLAQRLGLTGKVSFPGWVSSAEADRILAGAHVLVLPSHAEGLPMSVIEAMAHGVPVVTTPVGGIPDVVRDGGNGLLVPPGEPGAVAEALRGLALDEARRIALATGARRTWESGHAIGDYTRRLSQAWRRAAVRPRAPAGPHPVPPQISTTEWTTA